MKRKTMLLCVGAVLLSSWAVAQTRIKLPDIAPPSTPEDRLLVIAAGGGPGGVPILAVLRIDSASFVIDKTSTPWILRRAPGPSIVFIDQEVPGGLVDGANASFSLAGVPSTGSEQLFRNGLLMKRGFDYTIAGAGVTFLPGAIPQPGDTLMVFYRQ